MKIVDFLLELKSFVPVSEKDIVKATKSKITDLNNPNFKKLVTDWVKGKYDNDPDTLYFETASLLYKEKIK